MAVVISALCGKPGDGPGSDFWVIAALLNKKRPHHTEITRRLADMARGLAARSIPA